MWAMQAHARPLPTLRGSLLGRPVVPRLVAALPTRSVRARPCQPVATSAVTPQSPEAVARLQGLRGSAHKLRRVLDTIRGRSYEEALMILEFMPYRACEPVLQTLISAASNAKNNQGMSKTKLFISECYADEAQRLKRFRCRAKGRGYKILKPTSHLVIKVKEKQ